MHTTPNCNMQHTNIYITIHYPCISFMPIAYNTIQHHISVCNTTLTIQHHTINTTPYNQQTHIIQPTHTMRHTLNTTTQLPHHTTPHKPQHHRNTKYNTIHTHTIHIIINQYNTHRHTA